MNAITAAPAAGRCGLIALSTDPGRCQPFSPDEVLGYLASAGCPAVHVASPADLHACPVLELAAERGLVRQLTIGLPDGTRATWAEVRDSWYSRAGAGLAANHPLLWFWPLLPHRPLNALGELAAWLLHPINAKYEALAPSDRSIYWAAMVLGGPRVVRATADLPGGYFARLRRVGGRHTTRRAFLAAVGAVWCGDTEGREAFFDLLDEPAKDAMRAAGITA